MKPLMSMQLIQILLPVYNKLNVVFPASIFDNVRQELTDKFGGLTTYSRAPATGLWKETEEKTVKDDIMVYEIMAETLDYDWWQKYKTKMEEVFQQEEIVIRTWEIQLI